MESPPLSQIFDDFCYFSPPTLESLVKPLSNNNAIIIIDDDEDDETLDSRNHKKRVLSPSNSQPSSSTNSIITIDDDEETLEPCNKKRRLVGSWWESSEAFNELGCVVKGFSPKVKAVSSVTCLSTKSDHRDNFIDLTEEKESFGDSVIRRKKKPWEHVTLDDLGITLEELKKLPWDYPVDPACEIRSSDAVDSACEIRSSDTVDPACKIRSSSKKPYEHVTLDDLGVTVEDLKKLPSDAVDPTWEIRSKIMDPWLGGYIEALTNHH